MKAPQRLIPTDSNRFVSINVHVRPRLCVTSAGAGTHGHGPLLGTTFYAPLSPGPSVTIIPYPRPAIRNAAMTDRKEVLSIRIEQIECSFRHSSGGRRARQSSDIDCVACVEARAAAAAGDSARETGHPPGGWAQRTTDVTYTTDRDSKNVGVTAVSD